jgi:guanylate kinase
MSNAILVALVGPSGAGKTTLARALQAAGFGRIATTTTRAPRADEVVGRDLHTVSLQQFARMRTSSEVIATVEYSTASYGVQFKHLHAASLTALPQIIIVEPSGIEALKRFASQAKMKFAAVFVTLSPQIVRDRLETRYANEGGRDEERRRSPGACARRSKPMATRLSVGPRSGERRYAPRHGNGLRLDYATGRTGGHLRGVCIEPAPNDFRLAFYFLRRFT